MPPFDVGNLSQKHRPCWHTLAFTLASHVSAASLLGKPASAGTPERSSMPGRAAMLWEAQQLAGDSWSSHRSPCSLKWILPPLFPQVQHPGPEPAAWGLATCLKICACRTCHHPAQGNKLSLSRTALRINHASGKWVVWTRSPHCCDQVPVRMFECELKTRKQSTFHVPCRKAKTRFYLEVPPPSQRQKQACRLDVLSRTFRCQDLLATKRRGQDHQCGW